MYFPDRGCVRTLRTLYVYATGCTTRTYEPTTRKEVVLAHSYELVLKPCDHSLRNSWLSFVMLSSGAAYIQPVG